MSEGVFVKIIIYIALSSAVRKTAICIWVSISNYNGEHLGALLLIWGTR